MSNYDQEYYDDERSDNSFIMLPAGMVVGFALGPLYFSNPRIFVDAKDWLHKMILSFIPDNPDYVNYAMIGLLLVALFLLRGLLRKYWMLAGLALGVALWIPMGAHGTFYVPQVKTYFPKAEPELTLIVAKNPKFTAARNWALETFPIPPNAVPSLNDALAAEQAAAGAEATN